MSFSNNDVGAAAIGQKLEVWKGQTKTFDVIAKLNGVPQDVTGKIPYFTAKESINSDEAAIAINGTDNPTQAFVVTPQTGNDVGRVRFVIDGSQTQDLCEKNHVFDAWLTDGGTDRDNIIKAPQPGRPGGVMCVYRAVTEF